MRSEAYRLTGFTAVIGALGFLLRWLQNLRTIDPETGLATPGQGITTMVALLIIFVAAALMGLLYMMKDCTQPKTAEEALTGKTFAHKAVSLIPAVLLAVSGIVQLVQASVKFWPETEVGVRRVCAVATLAAAYGLVLVVTGAAKPEREKSRRVGGCILIGFSALWLIAQYKSAASDPVVWRFAIEILAVCASLMAFFYVSGYFFDVPNAKRAIFFCELGAFLCIMSCIDEHTAGEALCFMAAALIQLIWGFTLTANFRPGKEETTKENMAESTPPAPPRPDPAYLDEDE